MKCPRCGLEYELEAEPNAPPLTFSDMIPLLDSLPDISTRAWMCLKDAGIRTVDDLIELGPVKLLQLRNFGEKTLAEIVDALAAKGLELREPTEEERRIAEFRRICDRVRSRPTRAGRTVK